MRRSLLALGMFALVAVTVAADPPSKLGPEWTYDKAEQHYFKMMQIKTVRHSGGNVRGYRLDLEHDKVRVTDTDDNIATEVSLNETLSLEVRKDRKGVPSRVSVVVGKCGYCDFNGDGVWDAWYDGREGVRGKPNIWFNDRWVPVEDSKLGITTEQQRDLLDRNTEYSWDGKVWNVKRPK